MSNWQTYFQFKLDFQTVDQHGGKYVIHGTKGHKDNQLYRLELRRLHVQSNIQGENPSRNHPRSFAFAEPETFCYKLWSNIDLNIV